MGKHVIVTGRSQRKLEQLKNDLPGLQTYAMDMTKLDMLGKDVAELFKLYPDIDTVWINGGIQHTSSIKDASSSTDEEIVAEISTNVTGPMIIARHVVPLLVAKQTETTIMLTGSGLGFMPLGSMFPVYCATKSAIHSYTVGIRQALKDTSVNVIELVPPYVSTGLDSAHKDVVKNIPALTLENFVEQCFQLLDAQPAKDIKEIAPGTAGPRVALWRDSVGKGMTERGIGD